MQGRNEPCVCGSGKKFKKCCIGNVSPLIIRNLKTGDRVVKMSDKTAGMMEAQLERFAEKFGRKPGPNDPIFFDPDSDTPVPLSEEKMKAEGTAHFRAVGMSEETIYAWEKTGMIVVSGNEGLFTDEDLQEWEAAVKEYRSNHGTQEEEEL